MHPPQTDTLAIVSPICGVFAWIIACCGGIVPLVGLVALPFALLGFFLGAASLWRIRAEPEQLTGTPLAIVGVVLNGLLLAMMALGMVLIFFGVGLSVLGSAL